MKLFNLTQSINMELGDVSVGECAVTNSVVFGTKTEREVIEEALTAYLRGHDVYDESFFDGDDFLYYETEDFLKVVDSICEFLEYANQTGAKEATAWIYESAILASKIEQKAIIR